MADNVFSMRARKALKVLGANVKIARLKRRISIEGFAERVGVSKRTIMRLEKGEGGVGIGTLAMACLVLGELDLITRFFFLFADHTGLLLDRENLPKRIDKPRGGKAQDTQNKNRSVEADDNGVGF